MRLRALVLAAFMAVAGLVLSVPAAEPALADTGWNAPVADEIGDGDFTLMDTGWN
ncbi:hypothetical protein [Streptomyces sp. NRRL B-24484]|uniref:hypothetical protein n=1 Tax=Streptomyces sp. NRRL B-24484 TaxID=1463833 RepID=UPI000A4CD0CC|nr:hypothetical protein [Streptomyces sp. NRRL B-24484]